MVATDAPLATAVGVDILREGGNAIDAAIAIAFTLAVVYPEAGNIGGGGFMVARMADGTAAALDFREKAPLAASRDMYLDAQGEPTDRSVTGHLASGVPGAVAGLWEAHRRFGSVPWADLIAPAIRLARAGFVVDSAWAASLHAAADRLRAFDASRALFLPQGSPPETGAEWRNPDLATVLERIARHGADGFYRGETAELIIAEMRRGGGRITHEDLAAYQATWRSPVSIRYRGHTILSMPPPSSGGITLGLILGVLEEFPLSGGGWHSEQHVHLVAEAMRRAFADRNTFLGDPDHVGIPDFLTDSAYAARLAATLDPAHASRSADIRPGSARPPEPQQTTHFSVVDEAGNAVALTTTINELYGSAVTLSGGGFLLNDEMDDFTIRPGTPNLYGLVQGEANAIAPGKRMLSAMTPLIMTAPDGRVLLVTGARGGPRIISAVAQVISNIVDFGLPVGAAVHAPRIHHQHLPDVLYYEAGGLDTATVRALERMGHTVEARGAIGSGPAILWNGVAWTAVPDPRTGGLAAGY